MATVKVTITKKRVKKDSTSSKSISSVVINPEDQVVEEFKFEVEIPEEE